jgi:3-methylcrotonyl-CoA carboxylase alpha subunit
MFRKVLIANRGEIAVRIMATCRQMGIRTVAVYSEADRNARHVRESDEAYYIGPAVAAQSYLRGDAIIEVAQKSGAEAIHPGYGFLSENARFVEACRQAGIVFIGPSAEAMELMGSKIAAKRVAQEVGAPTVPGYSGESQESEVLRGEAARIGFPLLIKASAGGGGKGMREVRSEDEFLAQLEGAKREALGAFGDDTVFLERLLQQPRHIEIQILADSKGNVIHLGERECSIQRRHQKIIEESPSVVLSDALRKEMGEVAVRIARAAGYVNAGTLEFMLDQDGHFYFLEMNTRLQVEHPVTEYVTGLDVVRQQLIIASGEPLQLRQEQIGPRGHAIEARLYAEDVSNGFLPSTGVLTGYAEASGPGVRVDSGCERGDEITQYYDPMIAKLVVYGEDRAAAIARLRDALERSAIFGVITNVELLHKISMHPAFAEGLTYTNFLETYGLLRPEKDGEIADTIVLVAALSDMQQEQEGRREGRATGNPWKALGSWQMTGSIREVTYRDQEREYRVSMRKEQQGWRMTVNGRGYEGVEGKQGNNGLFLLTHAGEQTRSYVQRGESEIQVIQGGQLYRLRKRQALDVARSMHGGKVGSVQRTLTAPMAGTIVRVQVREGDMVEAQQVLVILSAMKMEHAVSAPYAGKVKRVFYEEGAVVKGGATVVEMEEATE